MPREPAFETNSSWLQRVTLAGTDRRAILKHAKPESDERPGMALLAWFDGQGAVEVLQADADAVLMAEAQARPALSRADDFTDPKAFEILVKTATALHGDRAKPRPAGLVPLTAVRAHVFGLPVTQNGRFDRWRDFAADFDLMGPAPVPLHGDIHHDNVLWEPGRAQWVVIDPKGYLGHPAYDFANLFFNPLAQADRVTARFEDAARITALAELIAAQASGVRDARQVLDFAYLYGGMSTIWGFDEAWAPARFRQFALLEALWLQGTSPRRPAII